MNQPLDYQTPKRSTRRHVGLWLIAGAVLGHIAGSYSARITIYEVLVNRRERVIVGGNYYTHAVVDVFEELSSRSPYGVPSLYVWTAYLVPVAILILACLWLGTKKTRNTSNQ